MLCDIRLWGDVGGGLLSGELIVEIAGTRFRPARGISRLQHFSRWKVSFCGCLVWFVCFTLLLLQEVGYTLWW